MAHKSPDKSCQVGKSLGKPKSLSQTLEQHLNQNIYLQILQWCFFDTCNKQIFLRIATAVIAENISEAITRHDYTLTHTTDNGQVLADHQLKIQSDLTEHDNE